LPWRLAPASQKRQESQSRDEVILDEGLIKVYIQSLSINQRATMRYSSQVKPISYLKANAAEVLLRLTERREPMVITQNGEAKAVIQDVASYEETQETLALLKILALGNREIEEGKVRSIADIVKRLRAKKASA
jgi:prevent-host-death family protein